MKAFIILMVSIVLLGCHKKDQVGIQEIAPTLTTQQVNSLLANKEFLLYNIYSDDGLRNVNNTLSVYDLDDTYTFDSVYHVCTKHDNGVINPWTQSREVPMYYNVTYGAHNEVLMDWQDPISYNPGIFTVERIRIETCSFIVSRLLEYGDGTSTTIYFVFSKRVK